jgi:hypothetical protein
MAQWSVREVRMCMRQGMSMNPGMSATRYTLIQIHRMLPCRGMKDIPRKSPYTSRSKSARYMSARMYTLG